MSAIVAGDAELAARLNGRVRHRAPTAVAIVTPQPLSTGSIARADNAHYVK